MARFPENPKGPLRFIQPLKTPQNLLFLTLEKPMVYPLYASPNRSEELK
jgi:hypothetical protein